jgi:glycerol-3-phosphate dehydrogenase (NAD(P)+)
MTTGPSVAIVGAGAWGTTLAAIVARREPVTLLCHRPDLADEIARTRRNERRPTS